METVTAYDVQTVYRKAGMTLPTPKATAMAEQANREADGVWAPIDLVKGWLRAEKDRTATVH
jgi:hypothetical protein